MSDSPLDLGRGRRLLVAAVIAVCVAVLIWRFQASSTFWQAFSAAALGALVAVAELVARYKDDPAGAVMSLPAMVYVGVNAAAAFGALYLVQAFDWDLGASATTVELTQVLAAGFGSAALFRSSLFNVPAGDQTIGIGPSAVLTVILNAADRAVDRQRALIRAEQAASIMNGFSFDTGAESLLHCSVATMQNMTADEASVVEDKIARLQKSTQIAPEMKSIILGMCLLTVTGPKVLKAAVDRVKQAEQRALDDGAPGTAAVERADKGSLLERIPVAGGVSVSELQETLGLDYRQMGNALSDLVSARKVRLDGDVVFRLAA